jgi:flagellar hook assembly protein FlgD
LGQNYPNPFNPSTIIHFELPKVSTITLDVFNILGQKVRTLIDRQLPAGIYNVTFDGRGDDRKPLASGVYLYRLTAENYSRSRAMMLLK